MKKLNCLGYSFFLVFFAALSASCYSQELPGKCGLMMIAFEPPKNQIIYSADLAYIARVEFADNKADLLEPWAHIYKLEGRKQYVFERSIKLEHHFFPKHSYLSNKGGLITIGEHSSRPNMDIVYVYQPGSLVSQRIDSSLIFNMDQQNESEALYESTDVCAPKKPWICWDFKPSVEKSRISIFSTLGDLVEIDIDTIHIEKKLGVESCPTFNK